MSGEGAAAPAAIGYDKLRRSLKDLEEQYAEAFQQAMQPVVEQIVANVQESHTLAALRDALLPKLICGQIRIRDAARQVECVA